MNAGLQVLKMWIVNLRMDKLVLDCVVLMDAEIHVTKKNETKCTMGSRQECHDETITEMLTETIMEQQCTGKVISFS